MFRPQPLSNEDLQKLRDAAQKKGSALTDEERAVITGAIPVTTRSGVPNGYEHPGDPRCR